jgi:hypothetical protein
MKLIPSAVNRAVSRRALEAGKISPTLLFGVGVVGMVGSTVLACRATLKVEEIVTETKARIDHAKSLEHENQESPEKEYTPEDFQKAASVIYARAAVNIGRLYVPSLLLGAASIGCLTKSHNILVQRNAALTAAYVAIDEAFTQYRSRVVAKYGEDQDREFRYSTEVVEIVDEKGKIQTETRVSADGASMYARFFDEYSTSWSKDPEYNWAFLTAQQKWCNDKLRMRGHMFLNEVYDELGLERTKAGQVVGWILRKDGSGDNFIDFGLYLDDPRVRNFINGREGSILLDFNVDGVIFDKINPVREKETRPWQS